MLFHALITVLVKTMEVIFIFGIIGSAVVVLLTGIEDAADAFKRDAEEPKATEER